MDNADVITTVNDGLSLIKEGLTKIGNALEGEDLVRDKIQLFRHKLRGELIELKCQDVRNVTIMVEDLVKINQLILDKILDKEGEGTDD